MHISAISQNELEDVCILAKIQHCASRGVQAEDRILQSPVIGGVGVKPRGGGWSLTMFRGHVASCVKVV